VYDRVVQQIMELFSNAIIGGLVRWAKQGMHESAVILRAGTDFHSTNSEDVDYIKQQYMKN